MAKITAAVRARAEADDLPQPRAPRGTPPLTAAHLRPYPGSEEAAGPAMPEPRVLNPKSGPLPKSARARSEEQPELAFAGEDSAEYLHPPLSLLESPSGIVRHHLSHDALEENARMLETVLEDYGVRGEIVSIRPGPVVTMYELEPAAGLKASRVIGLSDDIARSMSALACRVSTIPGRSVIGIELPNEMREKVLLREILSSKSYGDSPHALPAPVCHLDHTRARLTPEPEAGNRHVAIDYHRCMPGQVDGHETTCRGTANARFDADRGESRRDRHVGYGAAGLTYDLAGTGD
jgi:S-DNA-T family DNA segregation ATPase FtsK/SpoIIIE